jgi:hypothetical protein
MSWIKSLKYTYDNYYFDCITFVQTFAGSHGTHLVYNNLYKSSKDRFDSKFHKLQDVFLVNRTLIILDV